MKIPISKLLSIIAVPVIILTVLFTAFYWQQNKTAVSLPDYGAAPDFILIDQNNAAFDSKNLAGKPWVASFMFTRCPDICPLMTLKLGKLARQVQNMNYVSFTSDPNFDTPQVLAEYVNRGVGPKHWTFLAGDMESLKKIASNFMMALADNPGLHSSKFILVDKAGRIRGFYDSQSKEQMNALAIDARALLDVPDKIAA